MEFLDNEVESTGSFPYTILNEREQRKSHLELQRKKFELLGKELEKCETANEFDKLKCLERESRLLLAALEQEKADENVSKLLENHQRQREELNRIIVGLEQDLEAKQALELEAVQLKGILKRHETHGRTC
ncbi:hypothetical protein PanWU01x14_264500 [Parasponia andersonii]|uniref:Uncharacterized protein n=1 Tax=Parasponia andersonii TaxID=3476 RepID=A0A2P5B7L2_PARAD|nr:hypothetical protein PanWU01x14_264500 [Parasponia andersonii]